MASTKMGRYELIEPLGRGGMAEVWRARMRGAASFTREVALKVMLPDFAQDAAFVTMFVDEAVISAKLKHPNIVATLDFGRVSGRYFIALELIDGVPLRALLGPGRARRLTIDESVYLVAELAAALDYAYNALGEDGRPLRLVHRDVNPANVMVTSHGLVKLTDFGIAKAVGTGALTQAGQLKGKLSYMSPEQAWARPVDGRSDIYALGLLLYELVEGFRAIRGTNEIEVLDAARAGVTPSFGVSVPVGLQRVLGKALATAPEDRFATAAEMREALLALLDGVPIQRIEAALAEVVADALRAARTDAPSPDSFRPLDGDAVSAVDEDAGAAQDGTEVATGAGVVPPSAPAAAPSGSARWWGLLLLPVVAASAWWIRRVSDAGRPTAAAVDATPAAGVVPVDLGPPAASATPVRPAVPAPAVPTTVHPSAATSEHHSKQPATIRIAARPWAEVWVDGKDVGMTPLRPIELTPGRHEIIGTNPGLGKRRVVVTLAGGERKRIELQFDKGRP